MANLLWLAFALILRAQAQSNYNLTVSFSPSDLAECAANGSEEAITFSTGSVPPAYQCFNIDELFNATATESGSRTTQAAGSSTPYELISWRLYNQDAYDTAANYSRIWYQQQNLTSPDAGQDASRLFEVFSGRNCVQTNDSEESVHPLVGWTCQSSDAGDCSQVPYSVASFQVGSAWDINNKDDKCWSAYTGDAARQDGRVPTLLLAGLLTVALWASHF